MIYSWSHWNKNRIISKYIGPAWYVEIKRMVINKCIRQTKPSGCFYIWSIGNHLSGWRYPLLGSTNLCIIPNVKDHTILHPLVSLARSVIAPWPVLMWIGSKSHPLWRFSKEVLDSTSSITTSYVSLEKCHICKSKGGFHRDGSTAHWESPAESRAVIAFQFLSREFIRFLRQRIGSIRCLPCAPAAGLHPCMFMSTGGGQRPRTGPFTSTPGRCKRRCKRRDWASAHAAIQTQHDSLSPSLSVSVCLCVCVFYPLACPPRFYSFTPATSGRHLSILKWQPQLSRSQAQNAP